MNRSIATVGTALMAVVGCWAWEMMKDAHAAPKIYGDKIEPHWFADDTWFWYRNDGPGETREFVVVDISKGLREPAFDHEDVARQMGKGVAPNKLPIRNLEYDDSGSVVTLLGPNGSWQLDTASGSLEKADEDNDSADGLKSVEFFRPSRGGGAESGIVFENQLSDSVRLFWIDTSGERQPYGTVEPGQRRAQHTFENHVWLISNSGGEDIALFVARSQQEVAIIDGKEPKPRAQSERRRGRSRNDNTSAGSPDRRWEAFVRGNNLWIRRTAGGLEKQLTSDATPTNSFHRDAIRSRAIGMRYNTPDYPAQTPEVHWAPNSRYFVALQTIVVPEPRVTLVESSPRDQVQPKVESYPYIKPGDPIPQTTVRMFDADSGVELPVDQSVLENPWSIGRFRWGEDSSRITFLYNQRGHQALRLIAVELKEGNSSDRHEEAQSGEDENEKFLTTATTRVLIEETSDTFIDYSRKAYLNFLEERGEILWMSERDGWNHLYLYDANTGDLKRQLTEGEWMVRRIERVDENTGTVWFWAMGFHEEQDPYFEHLCRLDLNSNEEPLVLTRSNGNHTIQWSPDNQSFIATWSRVDRPPVHELRSAVNGAMICELEEADAGEIAETGYRFPEAFVAKGRDGVTKIFGVIHFPIDFDPTKSYPVVENIYAGPHGAFVPKSFRSRYRHQQEIADRGFIVVQIDGMGTNWRGKKFHDVAWKNIKDAGFPDRIAWMKAAAKTRPWMDISRVGIYGGSAGGQNSMRAVLDYSEFYRAAAADCGCHDNRMDKIWWNEAWMGLPGDGSYAKSSNVEDAHKLGGALLLTVGELDKNVDPSSTYQVVNALKRADKEFEFMLMTGQGHGSAESDYGRKLRADFFVKHLQLRK